MRDTTAYSFTPFGAARIHRTIHWRLIAAAVAVLALTAALLPTAPSPASAAQAAQRQAESLEAESIGVLLTAGDATLVEEPTAFVDDTGVDEDSAEVEFGFDLGLGELTGSATAVDVRAEGDLEDGTAGAFFEASALNVSFDLPGDADVDIITATDLTSEALVDCNNPGENRFGDTAIGSLEILGTMIDVEVEPEDGPFGATIPIPGGGEVTYTIFDGAFTQTGDTLTSEMILMSLELTVPTLNGDENATLAVGDVRATVDCGPLPPLSLTKTAEPDQFTDVGDEITYTLTAVNTTDRTIANVVITDELLPDLDCDPDQPATLAPGESLVCTGVYTITQEDVDNGEVVNVAFVTGDDEDCDDPCDQDEVIVPGPDPGREACPPTVSDVEGLTRLSGVNRVETAIAISQERFTDECVGEFEHLVLARADVFADSLSGTPLAEDEEAPLLITSSNELFDNVADEMQRVLPDGGTVFLLGGFVALDQTVEDAVVDLGYDIIRLGGPSRFETAGLIAEHLGDRDNVLIADGTDHSDALVAGTAGAANDGAVLLTPGPASHPVADDYLANEDATPVAVGGAAAAAYPNLPALLGATREGTAVAVAEAFFDDPSHVAFARRDDFPDALGGGAHIGAYGGPLLLTFPNAVPQETRDYLESISPTGGYAYGGTDAIDEDTFTELEALINDE